MNLGQWYRTSIGRRLAIMALVLTLVLASVLATAVVAVSLSGSVLAAKPPPPSGSKIAFARYTTAADFNAGTFAKTKVAATGDGALVLDPAAGLLQGTDTTGIYNGGSYLYGTWVSPVYTTNVAWLWSVPSWEADTPDGTWIQVELRALQSGVWTKYYNLGIWASGTGTIERHSLDSQGDKSGSVATDTLILKKSATALQFRATLFTTNSSLTPTIRQLAAVLVNTNLANALIPPNTAVWGTELAVPERSQMDYLPDGSGWCSPTSTSMIMAYWANITGNQTLDQTVPNAAAGCYDYVYEGTGNWPFNTGYAASFGLEGFVTRLQSMSQIEQWIGAGVPLAISISFGTGELDGAPISSTSGHLIVVRGFDAAGNVICNDPAADRTQGEVVRIVYNRAQLEAAWLGGSGGVVYVMYPTGHAIPGTPNGSW